MKQLFRDTIKKIFLKEKDELTYWTRTSKIDPFQSTKEYSSKFIRLEQPGKKQNKAKTNRQTKKLLFLRD